MVIQCDSCRALYRLDQTLVEGYRSARVRCRRCGQSIAVSVAPDPPALRNHPVLGIRAVHKELPPSPLPVPSPSGTRKQSAPRASRIAALAVSLEEKEAMEDPSPKNIVDFLRFRDSNRTRSFSGVSDISGNISSMIPDPGRTSGEIPPELSRTDGGASSVPRENSENRPSPFIEEPFLWSGIPPAKQTSLLSAARFTLVFTALCAAIAFLGFHLFRAILLRALE